MSGAAPPVEPAEFVLDVRAEEFLAWLAVERGRSPRTVEAYRRDLVRYQGHLAGCERSLDDVETGDVVAFVRARQHEGLAPASVTRMLVSVRGLHRFLVAEGHRVDDPSADVEIPSLPGGCPRPCRPLRSLR